MEVTDVGRRRERKKKGGRGGGAWILMVPYLDLLFLCVKVVFTQMSFLEPL